MAALGVCSEGSGSRHLDLRQLLRLEAWVNECNVPTAGVERLRGILATVERGRGERFDSLVTAG